MSPDNSIFYFHFFPAVPDHVAPARIKFQKIADASQFIGSEKRTARAAEKIDHGISDSAGIFDGPHDKPLRFFGRMCHLGNGFSRHFPHIAFVVVAVKIMALSFFPAVHDRLGFGFAFASLGFHDLLVLFFIIAPTYGKGRFDPNQGR